MFTHSSVLMIVSEKDVMDVERMYWALKGGGKLDLETFERHISPPMPQGLISGLLRVCEICELCGLVSCVGYVSYN